VPEVVLDASVLLAIFKDETYDDSVLDLIEGAVMSTVNVAEVLAKLVDLGLHVSPRVDDLLGLLDRMEPLSEAQARSSATLRGPTRNSGLSLGDRACLALALELKADVYTADRAWSRVDVGVSINLIR
jgi:ribonuclease VapC